MSLENDSLVNIPVEEWPKLKERFKAMGMPRGLTAWNTMHNQCYYMKKFKDFPVEVCAPFGNSDYGVVCLWKQVSYCTEVGIYTFNEDDCTKLQEAIIQTNRLDWKKRIFFACVMSHLVQCARNILKAKGFDCVIDETYVSHMPIEKAKKLNVEIPSDVEIAVALPEHAQEIDNLWPHRHPGSLDYFSYMTSKGLASALVIKESNQLAGWVLNSVRGDMHALQIKEEFKRRGYGQLLVQWIGQRMAEEEREVFGCIVITNEPSKSMFKKLGFQFVTVTSWIVAK